jgi:hypothetical protein
MSVAPSFESFGLLLGLSFFLGLAFEDFFSQAGTKRPGGVRTFPLLALAGGMLYLFDPVHLIPYTGGLLVLGGWLAVFYREHIRERDEQGEPNVGLVVLLVNVHAYLLGAIALALPNWIAVGTTVAAVLLLTGRERLHELARRIEMNEIVTAGQFLILTGLILPLLPNEPVTTLTSITPRQAWLALVVVCSLSYASYLAQRYWPPAAGGLWMAALGGLYSSTATTVGTPSQIQRSLTKAFQVTRLRWLSSSLRLRIIFSRQAMPLHLGAPELPCQARLHLLPLRSEASQLRSQWAVFGRKAVNQRQQLPPKLRCDQSEPVGGPNTCTGQHGAALMIARWWQCQYVTSSDRTPLARMLPVRR